MSTPPGYFEAMYAGSDDPWSLSSRWYEQRKHALTAAALTRPRYRSAFEPGCSVGALTALLAPRCERLLATDRVAGAVRTVRDRLGDRPGLRVEQGTVPDGWPAGRFDLVVLSEVGYYLDGTDLDRLVAAATRALDPDGELVAVHWRHPAADHAQSGDAVHRRLRSAPGLRRAVVHEEADFLLEVYQLPAADGSVPPSVAAREGLT